MTMTETINRVRRDICMCRSGDGWIMSTISRWPPTACWTSQEMGYDQARACVRRDRIERALDLLGIDDQEVVHVAVDADGRYEDIVRDTFRRSAP